MPAPAELGALRVLRLGEVELEIDGHRLRLAGTPVHLPHREFQVLQMLLSNAGRVVTRRELLDHVWGPDHPDVRKTLETHISRLRRRLRADGRPDHIRTVQGVGYIFDTSETDGG